MRYSDVVNDELVQEAMIQKVMDKYGVNEEAARTFLEDFDPDISRVAKVRLGSPEWYEDLKHIIWRGASDAEIIAMICNEEEVD